MAFAFGHFSISKTDFDGNSNISCLTYENVISKEELWNNKETVCVLGRNFCLPQQRKKFLSFVKSKLWCTYRKGFSAIGDTGPTSDTGWGCMLRCGQMMLAQALSLLSLSKDSEWRASKEKQSNAYRRILKQLSDHRQCCYSIHQIAQMGVAEGKAVGQWFGPNTVAQVLRRLSEFDRENIFSIHVAMDNTVCIKDIEKLCSLPLTTSSNPTTSRSDDYSPIATGRNAASTTNLSNGDVTEGNGAFWKPLFLIIPLRLGLSKINSVYYAHLKEILSWEESVGVIGGKPNHAYFFIGCSSDSLIYLDPHTTQPFINFPDVDSEEKYNDDSYHCDCPSRMPISQLDPSLALGFVCATKSQFENLCTKVKKFRKTKTAFPLFEILESFPKCNMKASRVLTVKSHSRQRRKDRSEGLDETEDNVCLTLDSDESLESDEEFEILEMH